ncbi:putative bldA-regulated nucleotide binding protein [Actinacidiphila reveromycinica]|uniref:Putative bldA-regulated nucleotide binding protein n=1 Tax=Actinacidiphila reveromycinica TaxID=659352 RepID=A0A7U3UY33_9ACTN|nr:putative bldA-regulated nucleotide binding protein [Streptomyces sp. SN-593]
MSSSPQRPIITELRLSAFKSHRGATFPLDPITLLTGTSGTGKSSVLEGLAVLGRLASGADLQEVFEVSRSGRSFVRGGAAACVPQGASPDAQGRRGFRVGCTAGGTLGPVRLDLAVQVEPTLRIVGERLTGLGETLLTTALRDPARSSVQAAWHTGDSVWVTRAPLPDDRLATSLLPLRVSGSTEGQRLVLAAAEQLVVALRGVFPVAPRPELMRGPVRVGDGRLRGSCDNLSAVLARTEHECSIRHGMLVGAVRDVCSGPVRGLTALPALIAGDGSEPLVEAVIAAVDRGGLGTVPVDRLGDGELRFLALALVLLTGPGVLDVDTSTEHLPAGQVLTVVADGLDVGVDRRQARELLRLAGLASARGHIRLLCTVQDSSLLEEAEGAEGALLMALGPGAELVRTTKKGASGEGAGGAEDDTGAGAGADAGEGADTGEGASPAGVGAGGGRVAEREPGGPMDVGGAVRVETVGSAEGAVGLGAEEAGAGPGTVAGAPSERGAGGREAAGGDESVNGEGGGAKGEDPSAAGPVDPARAADREGPGGTEPGAAVRFRPATAGPRPPRTGGARPVAAGEARVPAQSGPHRRASPGARGAAPAAVSPYGEPPFDRAGHEDFGYAAGFEYDGSAYGGLAWEGPDERGFEPADYVPTETVDDVPGHAEPAWLDSVFAPATAGPLPAALDVDVDVDVDLDDDGDGDDGDGGGGGGDGGDGSRG